MRSTVVISLLSYFKSELVRRLEGLVFEKIIVQSNESQRGRGVFLLFIELTFFFCILNYFYLYFFRSCDYCDKSFCDTSEFYRHANNFHRYDQVRLS